MYPDIFKRYEADAIEMTMRKIVASKSFKCHIATMGSDICGYMITYVKDYPETAFTLARKSLYIDQVAILDGFRRKGAGQAMVDFAVRMAVYSNIRYIEADHWTINSPAANFFMKNGFTPYREMLMKKI